MSRPKPTVLLSYTDPKTYKAEQVLEAEAVYAVFFNGKPVNLRTIHTFIDYPGPKYKKVAYGGNPGHAFNLVTKLNALFNTDKFAVYKLSQGVKITEDEE